MKAALLTIACILFSSCPLASRLAADEWPAELVKFRPAFKASIFTGAGEGNWDVKIRERGWILRDGKTYHMWYTGYDGTREGLKKLGYASSTDGIHWKRHAKNPIYSDHWVEDMMVIKKDGTFYMFAEGYKDQAHLLTSKDAINWQRIGELDVRMTDGSRIEPGPYGTPTGYVEGDTWYLFYERRDKGIWLAKSKDMKVWTNVTDDPIIVPGPDIADQDLVALNQIVKHDGRYYAYYHGAKSIEGPDLWTTNVAVSEDLIHWKKYPKNPLFPRETNKSSGILVHDGKAFRLYTMHNEVVMHVHQKK
ncbi:MAG: glycosylase [Planctomycetaceae bacterium]|nr:glycosylase [Planctomycetaceae bacterium]